MKKLLVVLALIALLPFAASVAAQSGTTPPDSVIVNKQTGTSYTFTSLDRSRLVTFTNGGAIAASLTLKSRGWYVYVSNRGVGTLTITPTAVMIDGAATLALTTGQGVLIASDGANFFTGNRGIGAAALGLPLSLANGGTGVALSDPGANRLFGWDDTDNAVNFLTIGSGLTYTHATHTLSASGGMAGSGTVNTLPKFTASSTLGDSLISEPGATDGNGTVMIRRDGNSNLGFEINNANADSNNVLTGLAINNQNISTAPVINLLSFGSSYSSVAAWTGSGALLVGNGSTGRKLVLNNRDNGPIEFYTNSTGGTPKWSILGAGHFTAPTDNTYDIGVSGATRPRTGYFGTSVVSPTFTNTNFTLIDTGTLDVNAAQIASFNHEVYIDFLTNLNFRASSGRTLKMQMTSAGHLLFSPDNTGDIGASGATRPRTGYFGTSVTAPLGYFGATSGSVNGNLNAFGTADFGDGTKQQLYIGDVTTTTKGIRIGYDPTGNGFGYISSGNSGVANTYTIISREIKLYADNNGIRFADDNFADIGGNGAERPRTGYFGTSVVAPTVNATTSYQVGGVVVYSGGTPSIAGNGTLNTGSKDSAGKVTATGTGASTIVLTFSITFTRAPACFVTNETTSNLVRPVSTTTTLTFNATIVTGDSLSYQCPGY